MYKYNPADPFFPLEILVKGWFPIFLNRVLYASFIVLLLFFWLIMFDGIRKVVTHCELTLTEHKEAVHRTFVNFYLPKVLLLGFLWVAGVTVYTWAQLQQINDPAFSTSSELPGFLVHPHFKW